MAEQVLHDGGDTRSGGNSPLGRVPARRSRVTLRPGYPVAPSRSDSNTSHGLGPAVLSLRCRFQPGAGAGVGPWMGTIGRLGLVAADPANGPHRHRGRLARPRSLDHARSFHLCRSRPCSQPCHRRCSANPTDPGRSFDGRPGGTHGLPPVRTKTIHRFRGNHHIRLLGAAPTPGHDGSSSISVGTQVPDHDRGDAGRGKT